MDQDINKLMHTISQLTEVERNKLLNFLIFKSSFISDKDKETIEYLAASSERLKKWMEDSDRLIGKMDDFFNELKKSA